MVFLMPRTRSYFCRVSRKLTRGHIFSTSFLPTKEINEVSPVIKVHINDRACMAMINLGCSCFLMNNLECLARSKENVNILTANREILNKDYMNLLKITVLVADNRLLGFNLIIGWDIIRKVNRVWISSSVKTVILTTEVADLYNP